MRKLFTIPFVFLCFGIPGSVLAEVDDRIMEEVIVTATHRQTNVMDTIGGITVMDAAAIERLGATDMEGLYRNISGLNMVEGVSSSNNRFAIRGVTSPTGTASFSLTHAAIAMYLDEVPMTSAQGPARQIGGNLFDTARVEVLKGPQGTLFGEGSVGGTIRFIQNAPQVGEWDYKMTASTHATASSNDNSHRIDGMVNIPLGDNVALRITGFNNDQAGWMDKNGPGGVRESDVNSEDHSGGRASVLWNVNERLSVDATYYLSRSHTDGSVLGQRAFEESFNIRIPGIPPNSDDDIDIGSLNFEYEFDAFTVQGFSSYMKRTAHTESEFGPDFAAGFDAFIQANIIGRSNFNALLGGLLGGGNFVDDPAAEVPTLLAAGAEFFFVCGTPPTPTLWILNALACFPPAGIGFNPLFDFSNPLGSPGGACGAAPLPACINNQLAFNNDSTAETDRWTGEIRLLSNTDGPFLWTAGVFYKTSEDKIDAFQPFLMAPGKNAPEILAVYDAFYSDPSNNHTDTLDEYSVYGEVTYAINHAWDVTAGTRITSMDQDFEQAGGTDDTKVSPKFSIGWRPTESALGYFTFSTGFRPGNANLGQNFNARIFRGAGDTVLPSVPGAGNPDMLTGNQAADLAESRIFYDGDEVFNYELGLKVSLLDGRANLTSSIYYLDWSDTIIGFTQDNLPTVNKQYNDNAGDAHTVGWETTFTAQLADWLNLTVGGDINEAETDEDGPVSATGTPIPSGSDLPFAPDWSFNATLLFDVPVPRGLTFNLMLNHTQVGEQWQNLANTTKIPHRHQTNIRANLLGGANDNWRVTLFVDNVTDEDKLTIDAGTAGNAFQRPRTGGIEMSYQR